MNTAESIARGIATKIVEGVRMLAAGIMAVANFIAKLFRDIALLLWEFGQWFIGILKELANGIVDAFRKVLEATSWVLRGIIMLIIEAIKTAMKTLGINVSGEFGSLEAELMETEKDRIRIGIYIDKYLSLIHI